MVACATNDTMKTCDDGGTSFLPRYISHLHMTIRSYLRRELESYGIGSGQYQFLLYLHRWDGCSQDELTRFAMVDKATTAREVGQLEMKGFVTRRRDPGDRRRYIISLTEKGHALWSRIVSVLEGWNVRALHGFDEAERDQLFSLLERLEMNMEGL